MPTPHTVRPVDLADEAEATAWYAAFARGSAEGRTAPLTESRTALLTSLRTTAANPLKDRFGYGVWAGDTCLGAAVLGLWLKENTHACELEIAVPVEHRRQGVGAALFDHATQVARERGRTLTEAELAVPTGQTAAESAGGRFLHARGFETVHLEWRLLLDTPVPEAALAALEAGAKPAADAGYTVVTWSGVVPPEYRDLLADLMTAMARDVPTGEIDLEPAVQDAERVEAQQRRWVGGGYGLLTALALDPHGVPVGYSMLMPVLGTPNAMQTDTFVARAHRGRKLSISLKTANLRRLAAEYPDVRHVHTGTADVNDAMRSINERFGFRAVEEVHELEAPVPPAAEA